MNRRPVYFDYAATSPLHPKVLEKITPYLNEHFGNPSSQHSFGRKVRVAVEESREVIASSINARPGEIYFVSGGTEANNFALKGIAKTTFQETGRDKIISSKVEHHSVLDTLPDLNKLGLNSSLLEVNNYGCVTAETLDNSIAENISVVSVIHVNNETGSVNDLTNLSPVIHKHGSFFHSDAVQSFGKIKIDVQSLGIDALSFSSHKIGGPKGIGALFVRSGTPLEPLIFGGSQERNRRGGTENVPGIIGFSEAVKISLSEINDNYNHVQSINEYFRNGINNIDKNGIEINSPSDGLPNILSISFKCPEYNNDTEAMLMYLDVNGIAVSSGSACTSGAIKPSHVILALGKSPEHARGTIRFSFGRGNTFEEADYALEILHKMSKKFRAG